MGADILHKTESELLFEQYLSSRGCNNWVYEPRGLAGQSKQPDYLVPFNGTDLLFEVKEMHQKEPARPGEAVSIDPYRSLRSEIEEARRKFKDLKQFHCSLVVYNVDDWQARLDTHVVFGSMLGDLGFSWPVRLDAPTIDAPTEIQNIFMDRGKMMRPRTREPQNTTISSIVVLERSTAFVPDIHRIAGKAVCDERIRLGRDLTLTETVMAEYAVWSSHPNSRFDVVRVRVYENPFAEKALPRGIFCGPYDMRWAYDPRSEKISQVFVGASWAAMEEAVRSSGDAQLITVN